MAFSWQDEREGNLGNVGQGVSTSKATGLTTQAGSNVPKYTPGQSVIDAQNQLQQIQSQKPKDYVSQYKPQLDAILAQITNPEKFKYEFNGDELFKYYADLYGQQGKQAMNSAMGQAAALTGGYGNSYAQSVGQQTYDDYLTKLYDKGLEFRDRAYQTYQDEKADRYNIYNTLNAAEQQDYGRYRDMLGDWLNERDYATNWYNNEYNRDYGLFSDDWNRNYQQNQADWERYVNERDYNMSREQYEQGVAQNYVMQILANGNMPSEAMLAAAGLSREDALLMMAQLETGGGSGGGGGGGRKKKTTDEPVTTGVDKAAAGYASLIASNKKKKQISGANVTGGGVDIRPSIYNTNMLK